MQHPGMQITMVLIMSPCMIQSLIILRGSSLRLLKQSIHKNSWLGGQSKFLLSEHLLSLTSYYRHLFPQQQSAAAAAQSAVMFRATLSQQRAAKAKAVADAEAAKQAATAATATTASAATAAAAAAGPASD